NLHDGVEILDLHFGETLVAQDAGIGDDHVDAAPCVHGLLDEMRHARVIGHGCAIGHRRAAAAELPPVPSTAPPRSFTTTFAPRLANSRAWQRPNPPPAPVTMTTLLS